MNKKERKLLEKIEKSVQSEPDFNRIKSRVNYDYIENKKTKRFPLFRVISLSSTFVVVLMISIIVPQIMLKDSKKTNDSNANTAAGNVVDSAENETPKKDADSSVAMTGTPEESKSSAPEMSEPNLSATDDTLQSLESNNDVYGMTIVYKNLEYELVPIILDELDNLEYIETIEKYKIYCLNDDTLIAISIDSSSAYKMILKNS